MVALKLVHAAVPTVLYDPWHRARTVQAPACGAFGSVQLSGEDAEVTCPKCIEECFLDLEPEPVIVERDR